MILLGVQVSQALLSHTELSDFPCALVHLPVSSRGATCNFQGGGEDEGYKSQRPLRRCHLLLVIL